VPSQAIANQTAAQLQQNPEQFAAVAARYAGSGSQTSAQPQKAPLSNLPPDLVARLQKTQKNEIFPYALANGGNTAYFVIQFGGIDAPTLEEVRPQLEAQTRQQAATAAKKYLQGVASDLGVTVNPRYGTWKADQLKITDFVNPVIKQTPSPAPPSGGTLPGDGTSGGAGTQPSPTPSG
jgi:peptidyl-prolyl cis-trans isomerase SurA